MTNTTPSRSPARWFHTLAPGILIAATGVGAGDLITASLAGSSVGVVLAWAALVGAVFKWVLNEGLARWQLATETTLLEGWIERLGRPIQWIFIIYLVIWTFCTGAALATACGVAGASLFTPGIPLATGKILWGVVHSLVGLVLVWVGGFRLFERIMSIFIGLMFVTVILTAILIRPDWSTLIKAVFVPRMPEGSRPLMLGVLGGVGGSVTLLSYGYWIREEGRKGVEGVRTCRIDLGVGYLMTALFGVAMILIGSRLTLTKGGDEVAIMLAGQLEQQLGPFGKWLFLIGFWGAVFSSLLGVWQSIPYLFADFWLIRRGTTSDERRSIDYTRTLPYRVYLVGLAIVPLVFLTRRLETVQLTYAVLAACFMPLLALTLLIMNNRKDWVGPRFKSGWIINVLLAATLAFFCYTGWLEIREKFAGKPSPPPARVTDGDTS